MDMQQAYATADLLRLHERLRQAERDRDHNAELCAAARRQITELEAEVKALTEELEAARKHR